MAKTIKVFISQPMKGLSDDFILKARKRAMDRVKEIYPNAKIKFLDSYQGEQAKDKEPLECLGEALIVLSQADVAFFMEGWDNSRGCQVEHICAIAYDIKVKHWE